MGYAKHLMMHEEEKWNEDVVDIIGKGHEDFYSFASEVMRNLTHPNPNFEEEDTMQELEWLWEDQVSRHADAN